MDDHSKLRARIDISGSLALGLGRSAAASVAAAVPILASSAGCQPHDNDDGFRITALAFDNDSSITLTFSETVADFGEVDPNDFRLSWATTVSFTYTYEGEPPYVYSHTAYRDLGLVLESYYYDYGPFTFASLAAGSAADQVVLQTTIPLGPEACDQLKQAKADAQGYAADYPGARFDFAIFLHYAGGAIPIESDGGSVLRDIGADWALDEDPYIGREGYGFIELAPQLRIPCP